MTEHIVPSDWSRCHDEEHGFSLRYPADWVALGGLRRCAGFRRGEPELPEGVGEIDVAIRVEWMREGGLDSFLRPGPAQSVEYSDRTEHTIGGHRALRTHFRAMGGPTPNWGTEWAISKGDRVLVAYISQPKPEVEADFDRVIHTLEW